MTALTRIATFQASTGQGEKLSRHLLHASSLIAESPGCELWLVHRDRFTPDTIRVTESWASEEQCEAALNLPGVRENADQAMELLSASPIVVEGEPIGGARVIRGSKGSTAFMISDAPDLSKDSELLGRYELEDVSEARYVREHLAAMQTGLTYYRLAPNHRPGWAHRHSVVEEIYVAISGDGRIMVDEESIELRPLMAVRVAPASVRELEAGAAGLVVLAFGSHSPGDGEMVAKA